MVDLEVKLVIEKLSSDLSVNQLVSRVMAPDDYARRYMLEDYAVIRLVSLLATWSKAFNEFFSQVCFVYSEFDPLDIALKFNFLHSLVLLLKFVKSLLLP